MTLKATRSTETSREVIQPSWGVFGPCGRCHANQWIPCRHTLRGGKLGAILRNPHPGRPQLPPHRWSPEVRPT